MLSRLRDGLLRAAQPLAARRTIPGVDVSSFQGRPAAWRSEAGRISWAAVKVTELEPSGLRYVNPDASADWSYLHRNKRFRLAYLFGHPSVSAPETVDFFIAELKNMGLGDRDGVALDLEVSDGLSAAEVSAWASDVMSALFHRLGRMPVLYTFLSFAYAGNCAGLGHYPLWIADPSSRAGHPQVPRPWTTWHIHQYDITGAIDRDVARYPSRVAMAAALGKLKEPNVKEIGGKIAGGLCSVRWPDATIVVAGLGENGYIQATRLVNGKWTAWENISKTKARGAPAMIAWGEKSGHLYYTSETGAVVELVTSTAGQKWG
ncbi:MAG: GH25 family lysozyme [Streptosporangiaceae bacterium]